MVEQKFIMNVDRYLIGIRDGQNFYAGIKITEEVKPLLKKIGFKELTPNQQLLPRPIGSRTRFNANGGFIKHKELPKEIHYRSVFLTDWHGNDHLVDIPYERFKRTSIPAPSIEFCLIESNGDLLLLSPELIKSNETSAKNKQVINILLEIFGRCDFFTTEFVPVLKELPIKRVNWEILPPGEYPWERLSEVIGNIKSNRPNVGKRQAHTMDRILRYKPSQVIVGVGGFRGYIIMAFEDKNLFVVENPLYGNATYVFDNNWEEFSKLSKSDIINNNLMKCRYEHRTGWESKIDKLLY